MVIQVLVTNFLVLSAIVNGFSLQSTTRGIFGRSVSKFTLEMAKEIKMPALSSTMKEGKIVAWSKNVGDKVSSGDVLLVVESDKADMDVESFEDGYLSSILTPEGGTADVGATVAILVDTPDQVGKSGLATPAPAAAAPVASTSAPAAATSSVTVSSEKILMPALSSTMKEGKIVSWAKKVGEKVSSGDILFIVESDKADMDVEAFEDGYLATIVTAEGAVAPVGSPVALIAKTSADVAAVQAQASAILSGAGASSASVVAPVAATVSASTPVATSAAAPAAVVNSGRVAASGYAQAVAKEAGVDLRTVTPARSDGFITASDLKTGSASSAGPVSTHVPAAGTINATPIARKLAAENNVDISKVKGTGNFGRVLPDDVLIFAGKKTVAPAPAPAPAASATVAAAPKAAAGGKPSATEEVFDGVKVMDGMQKAVSKNMEKTISVPIFRVSREIVTDNFDALYAQLKPKGVTVSTLLAKAVAEVCKKHPIINAAYTEQAGAPAIKFNKNINVAMAVAIDGGLITPTLIGAQDQDIYLLSRNWKDLLERTRAKKLSPAEYSSGTITISNLGMFGVQQFDAILPPNTGTILAIASSLPKVVQLKSGHFGVQKSMIVTLTCDHRHIYGADAAEFLKDLADLMENNVQSLVMG